ncbi:MAG: pentapeptide repeat-containing protein [Anaerolineae bacterium]|nr:pentapeptide repeat-containing protein [Anaerolineae bacterium]
MAAFSESLYENEIFKDLVFENGVLKNTQFRECSFVNCSFRETLFQACEFIDCVFKDCDLSLIQVHASSFKHTKFEGSKVIGVNWAKASWGNPQLSQISRPIDFFDCVLNYSTFIGLHLTKITIKNCIAKEVDFSETNLKQANLMYTDFSKSLFRNTDLTEANFVGAKDYFIVPDQNTLKQTKFSMPEALSLLYNLDIVLSDEDQEIVTP